MSAAIDRLHRSGRSCNTAGRDQRGGRLVAFMYRADITNDHVIALLLWSCLSPVVAALAALMHGTAGLIAALAIAIAIPSVLLGVRRNRRIVQLVAGLAPALDHIGRSLRSGASFRQSLDEAAIHTDETVSHELRAIVSEASQGRPIASVIADWAAAHDQPELRLVGAALALASENEAGTSRALDGVSQTLRERAALRSEVQSLTAQASASMLVLVVMPLALVALGLAIGSDSARFLFANQTGRLCLASGLTLDALGWLWMRRLVVTRMPTTTGRSARRVRRVQPKSIKAASGARTLFAGVALAALTAIVLPVAGLALFVLWIWLRPARARALRADLDKTLVDSLAQTIDLYAVALLSGHNIATATAEVGRWTSNPLRDALVSCGQQAKRGRVLADALESVAEDLGDTVRPLIAVLIANERHGAPIVETLRVLAIEVRLDRRRRAEAAARRLPVALLFPLVCCVLPAFILLTVVPVVAHTLGSVLF